MKNFIICISILIGGVSCAQRNTQENAINTIKEDQQVQLIDKTDSIKDKELKIFLNHFDLLRLPYSSRIYENVPPEKSTEYFEKRLIAYDLAHKYLGKTEDEKFYMWEDYNYDEDIRTWIKEEKKWLASFKIFCDNYIGIVYETYKTPQYDDSTFWVLKTIDYKGNSIDEIYMTEYLIGQGMDYGGFHTKDGINYTAYFFNTNYENFKDHDYIDKDKPTTIFYYKKYSISSNGQIKLTEDSGNIYLNEYKYNYLNNNNIYFEDLIK